MKSIIALPNNYVVVDLETTGLDYMWDDIIEISAVRFHDGIETARFEQLVAVGYELPTFITSLTGITDDMLIGCPHIDEAIGECAKFIGDDIVIGHNVTFDAHFLSHAYQKYLGTEFDNPCIDTMRIARKLLQDLKHHRLKDLAEHYNIAYTGAHRSGIDCNITNACYQQMRSSILAQGTEDEFCSKFAKHSNWKADAKLIKATIDTFDPEHPLYQKTVVFTGALSQMSRADAMQLVVNCGGICGNSVTKATNFLVVGTSDFISVKEGKKTSKMIKVEQLRAKGLDISTISEQTFFDLIGYNG